MGTRRNGVPSALADRRLRRERPCVPVRNDHYADSAARSQRVLQITSWIAAFVTGFFGIWQLFGGFGPARIGVVNTITAVVFLGIPYLRKYGDLVAPLTFIAVAYASVSFLTWNIGTGAGSQFYFLVSATIAVLILGMQRILLAGVVAAIGAGLVIVLELTVPDDTGVQPQWAVTFGFIVSVISAGVMAFATVWYAMREIAHAEAAMEMEYQRSETLLANILPESIATRLKDPTRDGMIADRYDDASILFADIAGFTRRASETAPCDLVAFLDSLYTQFDLLVDKHGLEKIKTSGDSYMVVSGVPEARTDHLQALAALALDMAEAVADLRDPQGQPVPLRIGLASGPVVAGVVGARRFFYDVWGDAVNVASRMETTDQEGRIQVPQAVYERLKDDFVLEERGDIAVKGKGLMHTWYLVARRDGRSPEGRTATADAAV